MEGAAADALVGDLTKPAFDQIQPGTAGGNEVHVEPRMPLQPPLDLGMLVRGVVVHDQVQVQVRRRLFVDQLQELDPLLMPMRGMQVPITLPSGILKAANKVVVPLRL